MPSAPISHTFNSVLITKDHLTKMSHLMPCKKLITDKATSRDDIYCLNGLFNDIILDQLKTILCWVHC